jgi:hypothetical protein
MVRRQTDAGAFHQMSCNDCLETIFLDLTGQTMRLAFVLVGDDWQ